MPLECELKVFSKISGITSAHAGNIVKVAGIVKSLYGMQEIFCTISTREILATLRLVPD